MPGSPVALASVFCSLLRDFFHIWDRLTIFAHTFWKSGLLREDRS